MNVLFIKSDPLVPGGPGVWFRSLVDELVIRGHRLYTLTWRYSTGSPLLPRTIKTYCFPEYAFSPLGISTFLSADLPTYAAISLMACKIIRSKNIDVIHTDSVHYGCSAALAKVVTGTPLVTTIHGYYPIEMDVYAKGSTRAAGTKVMKYLEEFTIDHTDVITLDMEWLKEWLGKRLQGKMCLYVPCGTPIPKLLENERAVERAIPRVLCPTKSVEQTKKISVAIDAAMKLSSLRPSIEISFICWGPDKNMCLPLQRYKNIKILNHLSHDEYQKLLKSTDLVWGQFAYGDLGYVEIEAMALGKPVITAVSNRIYRQDPPPVLSAWTSEQVVDHTLDFFSDPSKYSDTLRRARSWVERRHNVKTMTDQIEKVYYDVTRASQEVH